MVKLKRVQDAFSYVYLCSNKVLQPSLANYIGIASMDTATNQLTTDVAMQKTIAARVEAIHQAHANNLISNMDMGTDVFEAMLQRAREPISNEEFTRREQALWLQRHQVVEKASA
jgi:hypothetical protein